MPEAAAAEAAVPQAQAVFLDAIRAMTLADAHAILRGPDDAATRYFRDRTGPQLRARFAPIVAAATERTGATRSYKRFLERAVRLAPRLDLRGFELDAYVTDKALDGLFLLIAEEERRIRTDPLARGTELLRRVFGADR
jgi:hypothetical protein